MIPNFLVWFFVGSLLLVGVAAAAAEPFLVAVAPSLCLSTVDWDQRIVFSCCCYFSRGEADIRIQFQSATPAVVAVCPSVVRSEPLDRQPRLLQVQQARGR